MPLAANSGTAKDEGRGIEKHQVNRLVKKVPALEKQLLFKALFMLS